MHLCFYFLDSMELPQQSIALALVYANLNLELPVQQRLTEVREIPATSLHTVLSTVKEQIRILIEKSFALKLLL